MHSLLKSFASARSLIPAAATLALMGGLAALAGCDAQPGATAPVASIVPAAQAAPAAPAVAPAGQPQTRAQVFEGVKQMTALGKQLFFDPSLSGSGKLACASCHSAEHAFGPPNALSVQLGGDDMHRPGFRAVPSLKYLRGIPPFSEHFHDSPDEGDESIDAGPTGGLTWDGRVDTRDAQARIPLTSPFEMSSSPARVAKAVRAAPYVDAFRKAFGDKVLGDDQATFGAVLRALDAFQQQPALFDPYTSKYDAYLAGRAQLTPAE
jgi:cytochrome c peroxidase